MASCALILSDEKKEEEPAIDHSLKNIVAFSTARRKMAALKEPEGLFLRGDDGKALDRRTKIIYTDPKFQTDCYTRLCQVTALLPTKSKVVGSGCLISNESILTVLSCAHNFSAWSTLEGRFHFFECMLSYNMRLGEKSWRICSAIEEKVTKIHPKYDGTPDCGYDIAFCRQLKHISTTGEKEYRTVAINAPRTTTRWSPCDPSTLQKGYSIEICGYPGEKNGYPYTHTGTIVAVKKTKAGGYVIWHNVDCTAGNSGSPIIINDERWTKRYIKGSSKAIIGVHTGQDLFEGLNFGTLITSSVYKWIKGEERRWFKWIRGKK